MGDKPAATPVIIKQVEPPPATSVEVVPTPAPPQVVSVPAPQPVPEPTPPPAPPAAWDYLCVAFDSGNLTRLLNEAGSHGFELVSVGQLAPQDVLCFRRPRGT